MGEGLKKKKGKMKLKRERAAEGYDGDAMPEW
jgi:hypothetical protein